MVGYCLVNDQFFHSSHESIAVEVVLYPVSQLLGQGDKEIRSSGSNLHLNIYVPIKRYFKIIIALII